MDPQGACTTGRSLHGQEGGSVLASAGAVPTSAAAPPPLPAGARIDDDDASDEESSGGDFQGSFTSGHGSFTSGSKSMGAKNVTDYMREQDRFMPIANIAKIMARELAHTGHAKISQDTKTLMQECATEFICFIMSEANDQAAQAKRKAVSGQDIINACQNMGAHQCQQSLAPQRPWSATECRARRRPILTWYSRFVLCAVRRHARVGPADDQRASSPPATQTPPGQGGRGRAGPTAGASPPLPRVGRGGGADPPGTRREAGRGEGHDGGHAQHDVARGADAVGGTIGPTGCRVSDLGRLLARMYNLGGCDRLCSGGLAVALEANAVYAAGSRQFRQFGLHSVYIQFRLFTRAEPLGEIRLARLPRRQGQRASSRGARERAKRKQGTRGRAAELDRK